MKRLSIALCIALLSTVSTLAGRPSQSSQDSDWMSPDQIRPGMKGYGLTVFSGTTPERFEVEVLGILDGVPNPKQQTVLARLGGPAIDRTGVFAGMSGSPVYIDGKLVGAVAFTFPFSKEPIAGITPIKAMIQNVEAGANESPRTGQRVSFSTLTASTTSGSAVAPPSEVAAQYAPSSAGGQTLIPISTPVSFAGVPQSVIDLLASDLRKVGIQPVAGISASSRLGPMAEVNETTLTPGKSVSVQLTRGDFTIEAAGTVTYRDGDRIHAFGHTFLLSGTTSWPMAESPVITVVPNLNNSFKLSGPGNLVGAISQDRSTGVYGKLGEQPRLIPVRITVHTSRNKTETYSFEAVADSFLTPILLKISMIAAISATERGVGNQTIQVSGRIALAGQQDVVLDNTFSSPAGASVFAAASIEKPLALLLNSGLEKVDVRKIDLDVTASDRRSGGTLTRLWVDKTEVRRGENIEIQAFARNDSGAEFVERIPLEIPADAPAGQLLVVVGDGTTLSTGEVRGAEFAPKDLGQLVRAINKLKKNNRLYAKVMRSGVGAVVNNEEMPTLPPSVLATLGSQRTSGGFIPLSVATLTEQELPQSQFVITGQQAIAITVVK
ncbi:MAG TPA: SpoIVB peptidase S55 domain-containing protein [Blastocatellia bacterium]|nr:SpoIVB peptidase S55 domain-containing protein [Blastocatellia bacterium]